jgi:hypothetical protein
MPGLRSMPSRLHVHSFVMPDLISLPRTRYGGIQDQEWFETTGFLLSLE